MNTNSNSSHVVKMLVYQVAMTVFGLVLEMATYQYDGLLLGTSIFSIGFYLVLLYTMCWEAGLSDKARVDGGRMERNPWRFTLISLEANLFNLALGIGAFVGFVVNGCVNDAVNIQWAAELYSICNMIARFIQAMYAGVLYWISLSFNNPILLVLIVPPAIISCTLGYRLGLDGKTIRGMFGIQTPYDKMLKNDKKNSN